MHSNHIICPIRWLNTSPTFHQWPFISSANCSWNDQSFHTFSPFFLNVVRNILGFWARRRTDHRVSCSIMGSTGWNATSYPAYSTHKGLLYQKEWRLNFSGGIAFRSQSFQKIIWWRRYLVYTQIDSNTNCRPMTFYFEAMWRTTTNNFNRSRDLLNITFQFLIMTSHYISIDFH